MCLVPVAQRLNKSPSQDAIPADPTFILLRGCNVCGLVIAAMYWHSGLPQSVDLSTAGIFSESLGMSI